MIATVTLNPAVDRTLTIEDFVIGQVNRVGDSRRDAGGKGINVSKVLATLGLESRVYGLIGGAAGDFIAAYLAERQIESRLVRVEGETRTNIKIVDPRRKTHTDINESGPTASPAELNTLESYIFSTLTRGDIIVFSGSAPSGCDPGVYRRWIERAKTIGARTVLDADGDLLREGAAAAPTLIKPNQAELERLVGRSLPTETDLLDAMRVLIDSGVGAIVLSLGAAGALFSDAHGAYRAHGIAVEAMSTVGAGDSMLAAVVATMARGLPLESAIAPSVAAATASVALGGSGAIRAETIARYEKIVSYEAL